MFTHTTSLLFFAAAIQGFFLAGVLGLHRRNTQANHLLGVWIAILSLDLLQQIYYNDEFYKSFPQFITFPNMLPLSYGGFLYLYVRSLTRSQPLRLRDLGHFVFFFLCVAYNLPFLLQSDAVKLALIQKLVGATPPWPAHVFMLLLPLTASVYGVLAYRIVLRPPFRGDARLGWVRVMLGLNMLIWAVVWMSIFVPNYLRAINATVIYLLVSLVIYLFGYFSLRQPEIFIKGAIQDGPDSTTSESQPGSKYGENRLSDDLREQLWSTLESMMQSNTWWRESNLTLAQLSSYSGIASHHISQVLNDHHGLSFSDYLNRYRVGAVCASLQAAPEQNLLAVAHTCGFSSKSSFNAIFKKITGQTPSEYRKQFQS